MAKGLGLAVIAFGMLYVFALVFFLIGNFGLFGQDRDPLSGLFLIPLGLPWNRFVDMFPERLWPWLAAASPLVTLAILWILRMLALSKSRGLP